MICEFDSAVSIYEDDAVMGVLQKIAIPCFGLLQLDGNFFSYGDVFNGKESYLRSGSGQVTSPCVHEKAFVPDDREVQLNFNTLKLFALTEDGFKHLQQRGNTPLAGA